MEHFEKRHAIAGANAAAASSPQHPEGGGVSAQAQAHTGLASERREGTAAGPELATVSPWLYVAGLCVTLSGLYAVNYGREEPAFATTTYVIATFGYAVSYLLRRFRVEYDSLKLPLLVLVGLGLFAWLSTGQTGGAGDGDKVLTDRSHAMQILCVWVALLQPYASLSDMAVLSSCVPCMSLIALVSTTSPETEVQYSFLVFIAAATFLMVHENYLRTRSMAAVSGALRSERKLFGGQLQLAIGCVACAFLLANLVAIPMQSFGRSLSLANGWGQASNFTAKASSILSSVLGSDDKILAIATGPVAESDAVVMRVVASQVMNWRGATFDFYSGRAFENSHWSPRPLGSGDEATDLQSMRQFHPVDPQQKGGDAAQYKIPHSATEPAVRSMNNSRKIEQTVTMFFGGVSKCYAASSPLTITAPKDSRLVCTDEGSVFAESPFQAKAQYHITSVAPTDDESTIRAASSSIKDVPESIADRYLQLRAAGGLENDRLRQIALEITSGLENNYEKASAIHTYIAQHCKYNLQTPAAPQASDRVEYFLTVSKQGYCDSFAASMTMLSRYAGIPARVVTGYLPGKPDDTGGYLVRQQDKHAWSELYFSGVGWVPFDATEGADDISDHNQHGRTRRVDFLAWLLSNGILPPLLILALAGLIAYVAWTELAPRLRRTRQAKGTDGRPATNRAVVLAYLEACSALERRGLRRTRFLTPAEFLAKVRPNLATTAPQAADALTSLTALHDRFRYGREVASQTEAKEAQTLCATLRTALARVSPKALAALEPAQQTA